MPSIIPTIRHVVCQSHPDAQSLRHSLRAPVVQASDAVMAIFNPARETWQAPLFPAAPDRGTAKDADDPVDVPGK
jgi:hypothetical protein